LNDTVVFHMAKKMEKQILPGTQVTDPESGLKATIPRGWNGQKAQGVLVLQNPAVQGIIIVMNQAGWSEDQMRAEMQNDIRDTSMVLSPAGEIVERGPGVLSMAYDGTVNGAPAVATGFCKYIEGAGAIIIAAIASKGQSSPQLEDAAASIVQSITSTFQAASADELASFFAGTWVMISTNTTSRMILNPDGSYADESESTYSGQLRNATYGVQTGYWGVAGQNQATGRWVARGTKQRGVLALTAADGTQHSYNFNVHMENGKTYWNEYYFGGKLYSKQQ
jgi:hypothetical protein